MGNRVRSSVARRSLVAAAGCSAATWAYLALLHARFWRTDIRLPRLPIDSCWVPDAWPDVTAVVPARDEAEVLPRTLPTLLEQRYPGRLAVVVVDDCSVDGTADVARHFASNERLRVVDGSPTPPGWAGKVWAMEQGRRAAGAPTYVLLTDADIAHAPDGLARLVALAESDSRDLVSVMARLRAQTRWESLLVPAFVYFFAQLYPFPRVSGAGRTAAAAGGCLLVRAETLDAAGGFAAVADALIDDVALGRVVKRSGGRLWLGLADDVVSVRDYGKLADLWNMVGRSAFIQLRRSWCLLGVTIAGLALTYVVPPTALAVGLARRDRTLAALGGGTWAVMTATYVPMQREYAQPPVKALLLPVTAVMYAGMTLDSALRHLRGRGVAWKGRAYASRGGPA